MNIAALSPQLTGPTWAMPPASDPEMLLTLSARVQFSNECWGQKKIGRSARRKNRAKNKAARIARRKNR